jgi:hypothetical protein
MNAEWFSVTKMNLKTEEITTTCRVTTQKNGIFNV